MRFGFFDSGAFGSSFLHAMRESGKRAFEPNGKNDVRDGIF